MIGATKGSDLLSHLFHGVAVAALPVMLIFVWATSAQSSGGAKPSNVVALLSNNRLAEVDSDTGGLFRDLALAGVPAAGTFRPPGHYLALSRDRHALYVLVPDQPAGSNRLVVLALPDLSRRATYSFASGDARYQSLAVGPVTGHVYLFGSRPGTAVVSELDPEQGAILHTWAVKSLANWTPKGPVPGDFLIYQAAVAPGERTLYYSYYGGRLDLAGIDWLQRTPDGVIPCRATLKSGACLPGIAGFQFYGDGVLAVSADDTSSGTVFDVDRSGQVRRTLYFQLGGGFLMDFALDARAGKLYAVGSCGYRGGLSVLDLQSGAAEDPVPPGPPGMPAEHVPCGQRLALLPNGHLVVGNVPGALNPRAGVGGALLFLDTATGQTLREVPTSSQPIDVLVLPPA